MDTWGLRAPRSPPLVLPRAVDPTGASGPTKSQASGPSWRRTSPARYVTADVDRRVVEQRILEEAARLPPQGAVTGWAALRLHGAGYFDGYGPHDHSELPVPLVVPPDRNLRRSSGFILHRDRLPQSELTRQHGIPVTRPQRAAFDEARRAADLRAAVVVLDMALAPGVITARAFAEYLTAQAGWPGVRQVNRALELSDCRSMSPKETELRLIWMLDAGLPRPRCNWPVADSAGRVIGRPDLLCEELAMVAEFDGAEHRHRERHRDDLRRDDSFRAVGLEPVRFVGADLADIPLVVARLEASAARAKYVSGPRRWLLQSNPRPVC